jgi:hypothetical protein
MRMALERDARALRNRQEGLPHNILCWQVGAAASDRLALEPQLSSPSAFWPQRLRNEIFM